METKYSKVFAKKLIALFLSVLMALSCFTGALSAYAASVASDKDFHDGNLSANFMAWAETTDEQTCEALLDWADMHLEDLITGLLGDSHLKIYFNAVVLTIDINGYLDSIDGIFNLLDQVDSLLTGTLKTLAGGDIKNINLDPVGSDLGNRNGESISKAKSILGKNCAYRANYSAKELILALARFLEVNSNDVEGKNVIGNFLKGNLDLGSIITKALGGTVYDLLKDALGMWDGYQTNLVYNIVANLILENTKWFDDATLASYKADIRASNRTHAFNFDDVLAEALNSKLLDEIHAEITYPNYVPEPGNTSHYINDSSVMRYKRICEALGVSKLDGSVDQTSPAFVAAAQADAAANGYTYDPNVIYFTNNTKDNAATADMDLDTGCVYLFQYRNGTSVDKLRIAKTDNLYAFAFNALKFAWKTALQPTLGLVHVNYNVDRSNGEHGAHFDNNFFYWMVKNRTWDYSNWKSNYAAANVEAWADAVYAESNCASRDEFLAVVKNTYEYDRSVVDDPKYNWQDIEPTTLFNKLRYNPLADLYFNMQTGPINLYFEQTGIKPVSDFFNTAFTSYDNMVAGLNDCLVAATQILFLDSNNIGYGSQLVDGTYKPVQNLTVPTMATTGNTTNKDTIASVLIGNVVKMFEYAANVADANILNPYYHSKNISTKAGNLSEAVFEEAMIPLLIACLQQVNMTEPIHDEKWDSCKDAEGVAIVALEEYLSFVLPDKDYSVLWTYDSNGYITKKVGQTNLFDGAVMPMVRDALGYIISSTVPCRKADGSEWNVYKSSPTDSTTIFEILNSVMCYYASQDTFSDGTTGKAVATLLGVVNTNNQPLVTMNNDLWTNLDNIINTIFPAIGTAQYGTVASYGHANSYDLIYNDFIMGILDIGTVKESGDRGVTNLLKRLITIITSEPVSANKATPHDSGNNIIEMIYNLVADVANHVFGSRTDTRYKTIVPYAEYYDSDSYSDTNRATPFDSLLATHTLGYFSNGDGKETGMLGMLIYNVFKAFGGNGTTTGNTKTAGTMGCWTGAMFAVESVNYFIPSFCPSLSDHTLNTATASVETASQPGLTAGNAFTTTTLDIKNNSIGLNRFYRDANGQVQRKKRYFVYIRNITQSNDTGAAAVTLGNYDRVIQPEKMCRVKISGNAPANDTTYTFDIEYAIFEGEMNGTTKPSFSEDKVVKFNQNEDCSHLHTTAYLFLSTADDWASKVYGGGSTYADGITQYRGTGDAGKSNDYTISANGYGGSNITFGGPCLMPTFPADFIIPMSDAQSINNKCFLVHNCSNGTFGSNKAYDGVYATLMEGDKYYPVSYTGSGAGANYTGTISNTLTTAGQSSDSGERKYKIANRFIAYAAIDKSNGDILNYNRWDYTTDGGASWKRGPVIFYNFACGFSQDELNSAITDPNNSLYDRDAAAAKENGTFGTRIHVAWTLDEAIKCGVVAGVQRTKSKYVDGVQKYVYEGVLLNMKATSMTNQVTVNGNNESVSTKLLKGGNDPYESITFGTPTPGVYFACAKETVDKGGDKWPTLFNYDGSTELSVQNYEMGVFLYTTANQNMFSKINMYVADDTASTDLKRAYNEALKAYSTYTVNDVTDPAAYTNMAAALKKAVGTIATPVSKTNATKLGSTMVTVPATNTAYDTVGDKVYKPLKATAELDPSLQANATKGVSEVDGVEYWYYDKDCVIPICSNVAATASDVQTVSGKTVLKASKAFEVSLVDGTYRYVNAQQYEYKWETNLTDGDGNAVLPIMIKTNKPVLNDKDEPVYSRISFTCYDNQGRAMDSRGNWTYTIADRWSVIKEYDGNDYRGVYQRDVDNLNYYLEQLKKNVNQEVASIIVNGVTKDRKGLNSVNYDVASYEKMVQIARDAEKLVWQEEIEGTERFCAYNKAGEKVLVTKSSNSTSINTLYVDGEGNEYKNEDVWRECDYEDATDKSLTQLNAGLMMYNDFKGYVIDRGYIGDKLEAEINCATGYDYTALDFAKETQEVTPAEGDPYDEVLNATITSTTATTAKYGTWKNGTLVNEKEDGSQAYTDDSWKACVIALANGIEIADEQTKAVSGTYTAKTDIQKAENNLEEYTGEPASDGITISGTVTIATDIPATLGTTGIVDLTVATEDGTVSVQTAADGTFEIVVPTGTTSLVISGHSAIAKTVTLSGTQDISGVIIPINICDYVKDDKVNSFDDSKFKQALKSSYDVYYDIIKDNKVNTFDNTQFKKFLNQTIVYADQAID